jgi:tetratricopeptide (TPR) repeat protein
VCSAVGYKPDSLMKPSLIIDSEVAVVLAYIRCSDGLNVRLVRHHARTRHHEPACPELPTPAFLVQIAQPLQKLPRRFSLDPQDASAYHNLGTLLLRTARYDEAVQAYRQSVRFRLNHPATYFSLGYALKDSGRIEEAVGAWEQALRLAPNDPSAKGELMRHGRMAMSRELGLLTH